MLFRSKKAKIKNQESGEYEDIRGAKMIPGQVKMISKQPVKLRTSEGSEVEKQIMVTCRLLKRSCSEVTLADSGIDEMEAEVTQDTLTDTDGSLNFDQLSLEENDDSEEDMDQGEEFVIPEHFDKDSIHTKSSGGETMKTKSNEYRYAASSKTQVLAAPSSFAPINKHFAKKTTLLLLAAKTKSWGVVKAILELDPVKYPILFTDPEPKSLKKHPLYHQDDSKTNCLNVAIEDGQVEIGRAHV